MQLQSGGQVDVERMLLNRLSIQSLELMFMAMRNEFRYPSGPGALFGLSTEMALSSSKGEIGSSSSGMCLVVASSTV